MFEYSFVPSGDAPRPLPLVVAGLTEVILLSSLVVVPLLFVQALPERALLKAIMLAPVPVAPPPPPPPILAKVIPRAAPPPARKFNPEALVSPVVIPKAVAIINEAPAIEMEAVPGGVPGGIPGAALTGGTSFLSSALSVAPPPPPSKTAAPPAPVAPPPSVPTQIVVGGDVEAGLLLEQPPPIYPRLARMGRIAGTVKLSAVIGTDGRIKNLAAVSGHPMLIESAMNAVRRWVYKPTLLDGVPVEVKTEIEVHFNLTS